MDARPGITPDRMALTILSCVQLTERIRPAMEIGAEIRHLTELFGVTRKLALVRAVFKMFKENQETPAYRLLNPTSLTDAFRILCIERIADYETWMDDLKNEIYIRVLARLADTYLDELLLWDAKRLSSVARGLLSDLLQERAAKRRGGTGGRKAKTLGTQTAQIGMVDIDAADETQILEVDGAELERKSAEDHVSECQEADLLYRAAYQNWGAPGIGFVRALSDGATVEEASHTAGISRASGYNWLNKLRKTVSPSRP